MKLTKKRIAGLLAALFVLALLGFAIFYVVISNQRHVELGPDAIVQVDRGDMTSVFMTSATVESGRRGVFEILDGTLVTEVHVRPGDAVQEGDLLATFDASRLDEMLAQRRRDHENARGAYQNYMRNVHNAPNHSAVLQQQIAELEARIAQLQAAEQAPAPEAPQGNAQLDDMRRVLAGLMGNTTAANWLVNQVLLAEGGNVEQTITAFQNMLSGSMLGGLGNFDMGAMMGNMGGLMDTELLGATMQLMQLRVQESMMGLQAGVNLDNVYRALAESAESAYRQASAAITQLRGGWYATHNGVVREVNITAGEIYRDNSGDNNNLNMTAMLASLAMGNADISAMLGGLFGNAVNGMVIEYYPFTASFMLGRYDIARVRLDQPVRVTSVSGEEFEGIIYHINPVAADSGGFDVGAIIGGGGGGARGVQARISIPEPDLSLTIGLDVDITIDLESRENALRVPAGSLRYDAETESSYVFVIDRANRTVRQVFVEIGLFDNSDATSWHEILGGITEGTEILRAPPRNMQDGDRVRIA